MKKLSLIVLFLLFSVYGFSQSRGTRFGAQAGIGQAWFSTTDRGNVFNNINATPKLFFGAGLGASHQFTPWFGLTSNVLFTSKGQSFTGEEKGVADVFGYTPTYTYEETYRMLYTEIPVMAKVSAGFNNFYVKAFAGPSIGFNLRSVQQRAYNDQHYNDEHGFVRAIHPSQIAELAVVAGVGFDVELKDEQVFFLDMRVNNALNNWGKINNQSAYNNYFSINIGYLMKY